MLGPLGYEVNEMVSLLSSLQLRVLRLGFLQDRDVGVGVFPEGEEVLIGGASLGGVSLQRVRTSQAEMGQYARREVHNNATVLEQFLKLRGGSGAIVCKQVGAAAKISWIEASYLHRGGR